MSRSSRLLIAFALVLSGLALIPQVSLFAGVVSWQRFAGGYEDIVTVRRAEWRGDRGDNELRVRATTTAGGNATLRVYETSTNQLIGVLTYEGGDEHRGEFFWSHNPMVITVRSSQGGEATVPVWGDDPPTVTPSASPPTSTPSATTQPTHTATATEVPASTATATATATGVPASTATPTATATEVPPGSTATPTATATEVPPDSTATPTATATEVPPGSTATPTATATPIPSNPMIHLNYETGAPGSYFTVMGMDYPANSLVGLYVNGIRLGTIGVNEIGSFVVVLDTEGAESGNYIVTAELEPSAPAAPSGDPAATFTLDPAEPVRPLEDPDAPLLEVPPGIAFNEEWNLYLPLMYKE